MGVRPPDGYKRRANRLKLFEISVSRGVAAILLELQHFTSLPVLIYDDGVMMATELDDWIHLSLRHIRLSGDKTKLGRFSKKCEPTDMELEALQCVSALCRPFPLTIRLARVLLSLDWIAA